MSVSDAERHDRLVLSLIFEPGEPVVADLIARYGASETLALVHDDLVAADVITDAGERLPQIRPDGVLRHAEQIGARFVVPGDEEWPEQLADLAHAGRLSSRGGVPIGLWVKGRPLHELVPRVAVVGSRAATTYGTNAAGLIAAELAAAGWVVMSGGAYGIDEAAHRAALAVGAPSVVALAHGLDRVYPVGNEELVAECSREGALVSELAPGASPMRVRFLSRNRVIAAMSAGTVVVEAGTRSGALNTAHWTTRLSRPLLAVPGPASSAVSAGTHDLIRSGAAVLATTGAEVLEVVDATGASLVEPPRAPEGRRDRLDPRARRLLEAVPV
ncbi:MAG: DNA-processing protein DprA, partial [Nocardioides sp.]|uniref:DNA-processing protein DprA n=1 Tax=Nocardioides sp. TaxID=35761 RepID=UPI0039E3C603